MTTEFNYKQLWDIVWDVPLIYTKSNDTEEGEKGDQPTAEHANPPAKTPYDPSAIYEDYDMDMIYEKTVAIIGQLVQAYHAGDHSYIQKLRKAQIIGENESILSAVARLQKIANSRDELVYKYKLGDKQMVKKVTKDQLEIIRQFIERLPNKKIAAQVKAGTYKDE